MSIDFDRERALRASTGFLARVASADFRNGRLSRSLGGTGVAALTEAIYGIVLGIPESRVLVELAREDLRDLISRPPRGTFGASYRRAKELEALETCGWLLSGSTDRSLIGEALALREAEERAQTDTRVSIEAVDELLPLAFLAGLPERGKAFSARSKRAVSGTATPRGVALSLFESAAAGLPLVESLLKRKLPVWFTRGWLAYAVPWLRIRAQLQQSTDSPFRVIESASDFLM